MADPESPSCRVLVVSSTAALAKDVAHRIKSLSGDGVDKTGSNVSIMDQDISWRISNKYYTADVHFRAVQLGYLEHEELDEIPALIYVWTGDESYKTDMTILKQHIGSTEFEVSLAISTHPTSQEDLEDQLFSHGLEYIDGSSPFTSTSGAAETDSTIAPGLRRALDALSTIMWPSMTRATPSSKSSHTRTPVGSHQLDDADLALQALIADTGALSDELSTNRTSRLKREMDELEKWLNEDAMSENGSSSDGDPWERKNITLSAGDSNGFEDDFSEFVSGPSQSDDLDAGGGPHPFAQLDDEDGELPSRREIESTASRIFDNTAGANRDLEEDGPTFDLTRILSALQGMKEEIAGIEDETERRKAAAKVALGLVYGLEGFSEADEDDRDDLLRTSRTGSS